MCYIGRRGKGRGKVGKEQRDKVSEPSEREEESGGYEQNILYLYKKSNTNQIYKMHL